MRIKSQLIGQGVKAIKIKNLEIKSKADLCGADLREANLQEANLQEANLQGADLQGADLQGADLRWADLCGANLREADLRWADLCGANLQGTLLILSGLTWPVYIRKFDLQIGCKIHSLDKWENFSDDLINKMNSAALEFWKANKSAIFALHENYNWE